MALNASRQGRWNTGAKGGEAGGGGGGKSALLMLSTDVIISHFLLTFALSGSTSVYSRDVMTCHVIQQFLEAHVGKEQPVSYNSDVIMTS